jgi:hypothetical protein
MLAGRGSRAWKGWQRRKGKEKKRREKEDR